MKAPTLEGTFGVQAATSMLTRITTKGALVDVQVASRSCVTRWTCADRLAIDRICVTVGAFLTRIANASIVKVAQQPCTSMWTLAEEGRNAVMTSGPIVARSTGAVIYVLAAVAPRPPVDADAVEAAMSVMARSTILTCVWHQLAFVHIFCAVLAGVMRWALAVVRVHAVHTDATVLAAVARTIVDVVLTVVAHKTWQAAAVVGSFSLLNTCSSILAG